MSLLVILGAGASHDCVNEQQAINESVAKPFQWIPPLTDQLFEPRASFGETLSRTPQVRGLVVALRSQLDAGHTTLEQELDRVQVRASDGDANATIELMALRFYLREVLEGCSNNWPDDAFGATNYHWLVRRLDQWARDVGEEVVYVTFNYDTILERAFVDELRQGMNTLDDYLAHPRARLYKPHGSVNWGQRVVRPAPYDDERSWVINNAAALPEIGPIEIRRDWSSMIQGEAWVPALAVPFESKSAFVCPDGHLDRLIVDLGAVDRILVIGWRATEQHFLGMLKSHLVSDLRGFAVACRTSDEARRTSMQVLDGRGGVRGHIDNSSDTGFSQLVGHDMVDYLLRT